MTTEQGNIVREGIADLFYSTSKFISATVVIFAAIWIFFKPVVEPFLEVPEKLERVVKDVQRIEIKVSEGKNLQYATFLGNGQIVDSTNQFIDVLYIMNRKVACAVEVTPRFYNVDKAFMHVGTPKQAIKSPTVELHNPFKLRISLPSNLPDGKYVYLPTLRPIDCGAYGTIVPPPSEVFIHDQVTK